MKLSKRILAAFIAFTLIISTVPQVLDFMTQKAKAAAAGSVTVNVAAITSSSVTLAWQKVNGAISYDLGYYNATSSVYSIQNIDSTVFDSVDNDQIQINNLSTDFVYNFVVTAKDGTGNIISTNNKQVMTGISMDVSAVTEAPVHMDGGGYEVGVDPQLEFRIKIPDAYNGTTVSEYAYNNIDYDINMGNNVGGSSLDRIKVRYSSGINQYIATTYINDQVMTVAAKVYTDELEPGYMNFFVLGQNAYAPTDATTSQIVSEYSGNPETSFDPSNISEDITQTSKSINLDNIMRDIEITPSMAIKMTILPKIHDALYANAASYLQTAVIGGFVSTPIRFQMNKDSSNNIIATIYRVNQGTSFTYELDASPAIDFPPPLPPQTDNIIASRSDSDAGTSPTLRIYVENQSNNSTYYFMVKAYDSSGDTLTSSPIGYSPSQDSPLAPLPEGLQVLSVTQTQGDVSDTFYNKDNSVYTVKSADVKLIWNKPSNYDDLYTKMSNPTSVEDSVYYHVMISSFSDGGNIGDKESFSDMFGDVMNPSKEYTVTDVAYKGYREVYTIDLTACDVVDATGQPTIGGGYLSYTIKGLTLFSKATGFASPILSQPPVSVTQDLTMNSDLYPTYLLPNRIYYAKMFTTKGTAPQSDNSLAVSFTTPLDGKKSPPVPNNFKLIENNVDSNALNYVKLEWDKINFNLADYTTQTSVAYSVYYDLYISDSMDTNSFSLVGSGEQTANESEGDAAFAGLSNISTVVDSTVSQFTLSELTDRFGSGLKPNTTYYFAVATRVSIGGQIQSSAGFSQILSVTTTKGSIVPPDTGETVPKAPQDFNIAVDSNGNKIMDSSSVQLTWSKLESDVKYILIQTTTKIDSNITLDTLTSSGIPYTPLLDTPGEDETNQDGTTFIYDPIKKVFTYNVTGLMPNTVYYFSLMAVRTDDTSGNTTNSIWVSVPATTALIEAPDLLSVVADNEEGIWWDETDNTDPFNSADFYDIAATENGVNIGSIPRSQVFVSKVVSSTSTRYYARIVGLKKNSQYSFNVTAYKSGTAVGSVVSIANSETGDSTNPMYLDTREDMHEIDVAWKGKDGYNFQLALKGENDINYTVLTEGTSEFTYLSVEKPSSLIGTDYSMYYARIRTTDGTTILKSNTKYYIKVRSTMSITDTDNNTISNLSKYIGPVDTRTEFSQTDYDNNDQSNKESASYADRVNQFKNSIYWEMGYDTGIYKIKLRKDMVENLINHSSNNSFILDLTNTTRTDDITERIIYIPLTTIQLLTAKGENLVIRIPGTEITYKPGTIDLDNTSQITDMVSNTSVKETYIYIDINKASGPSGDLPTNTAVASDIQTFSVQVKGTYIADSDMEAAIKTELDSLIAAGLKNLQSVDPSYKNTSQLLDDQINSIVSGFDLTLEDYIRDYIEGNSTTGFTSQIVDSSDVTSFTKPLGVKMTYTSTLNGPKSGYVYSSDSNAWSAKTSFMSASNGTVTFDTMTTGDYAILNSSSVGIFNIPDGHWAQKDINAFTSKYDLSDVFQGGNYANIDDPITLNDTVLVIGKVLPAAANSSNSNVISTKAAELGLDGTTNFTTPTRNITRQDLAALMMRVYKLKSGVDPAVMKPSKTIIINDESGISNTYYKEVEMSIDMKILSLDDKSNFRPNEICSKAQMISAITRVLRIVGEL